MKPFSDEIREQKEDFANQRYFNMLKRERWLPVIRFKDKRTSEKPKPQYLPELELLEEGKEN